MTSFLSLESSAWCDTLLRFNLNVATYIDVSWLPDWIDQASPLVLEALSLQILREHKLEALFDWCMQREPGRLFMIDREDRNILAIAVGVAACRDSVRRVVAQSHLELLRDALGDSFEGLWLPEVEAIPRSFSKWSPSWHSFNKSRVRQHFLDEGMRQMLRLVDSGVSSCDALVGRARLCASRAANEHLLAELNSIEATKFWNVILNYMIPRWAPSWNFLF